MRRFLAFCLLLSTAVFFGVGQGGVRLESSTFTPDLGRPVSVFVRGAPRGATIRWDLDDDGTYERVGEEHLITFTMAEGIRRVTVEVASGGQTLARLTALFVADSRLGAFRTVIPEGHSFLVTVTILPKAALIAPGFLEVIPTGFALEVVDEGGAFWRRAERLEVVWPIILEFGQAVSFTYRLYPLSGVSFQFSGLVSAYVGGKRVEIPIAGAISP
jgi:hypothetical protein